MLQENGRFILSYFPYLAMPSSRYVLENDVHFPYIIIKEFLGGHVEMDCGLSIKYDKISYTFSSMY